MVKQLKQPSEKLVSLNTSRLLLDSVGEKKIAALIKSYLKLLNTAAAAYEANGDYAARFFASEWCKLLDNASRKLCHTKDDKKALACGKWLCHESCWKNSKKAIETGSPVDCDSACGLRLYGVPIKTNGKSVGVIYFCYQGPPKDEKKLKKLALLFKCDYEDLKKASAAYKSRPAYVIASAKRQLNISAELLGLVIEHKLTLAELSERIKELELTTELSNILRKHFHQSVGELLKRIIITVPKAFKDSANISAQFIYKDETFKTKNLSKTKLFLKDSINLDKNEKLKIEIFSSAALPLKKGAAVFLSEEKRLVHNFMQLIAEVIFRKNTEKKLLESHERFKSIFEHAGDGILAADIKTKRFCFSNPRACEITGYPLRELLEMSVSDIHPAKNFPYIQRQFKLQAAGKISFAENIPILRKDGSVLFCDINAKTTLIGNHKYLVGFFRDITHRLELENILKIKTRHIMILSKINQELVYSTNEKDFLHAVCRILVNSGEYASSWVGFTEDDANKTIKPIESFDFPVNIFKKIDLSWAKKKYGLGIIGTAIRTGKTNFSNNLFNDILYEIYLKYAKSKNYRSLISLPLTKKNRVYGILNIYSEKKDAFDAAEIPLLEEIANDLSYGISVLALEKEKKAVDLAKERITLSLRKSLEDTISIISSATEKRDPYTAGHQNRVAQLAVAIAKKLQLPDKIIEGIYFGSLIHDIGKIYVPAEILTRPGKLTPSELAIVREHPTIGNDIVAKIDFIWPIQDIILHHHERLNGSGYPDKLRGEKISIECRIIGVADVVEAMSSHRPYRAALKIDVALNEIKKNSGTRYDPKVVIACIELFKEGFSFIKQGTYFYQKYDE